MSQVVLLVIFAAFGMGIVGLWVVAVRQWDRKRPTLSQRLIQDPEDELRGMAVTVVLPASVSEVSNLAKAAMREMRGRSIEQHGGGLVTGWVGHTLTNIPGRGEYQLIVSATRLANGETEALCATRPRFKPALFSDARSTELRQRLAQALSAGAAQLRDS
jgi:hypothetical protein